ncbi:MAG: phytanoyl-CoA dioxygenase family protein, partial [Aliifodinibius sp.]|nr:phytanoyl-CoA dioxygenase family protein [Fodinibius sp.]NIV12379.1 phytanoyl-CoA dioxygenase family protein [Fodinibius sp.]NIY26044.1 phytanoyl-CoA dioxygenase family protein [Fodinibius sp.]
YVNFWIPLDDVNEANGTIYILPFSEAGTRERVEHRQVEGSSDRIGYFGDQPGKAVVCPAGSIAVFSSVSFHKSGPNTTENMRRAYSIQFSTEPILEADGTLKGLAVPFLENGKRVK